MAMRGVRERPAGLVHHSGLVTPAEEAELLAELDAMDFEAVVMRGQTARRTVRHFGFGYDFDSWQVRPTEPIPPSLLELRERAATVTGQAAGDFVQALVTRYPPGASIGWHQDATAFGPVVLGVSLRADCAMRFQRRAAGGERRVFEQPLERRSAYALTGSARSAWQHSIPPVAELRYSVTFRAVRAH